MAEGEKTFVTGAKAPAPRPAREDPAVVARKAAAQLDLPQPVIRMNPDERREQLVRVPTWLWIDQSAWKPVSKQVAVPEVTVVATGRPAQTVWEMGDGATVVCHGAGTPYSRGIPPSRRSPDCGHTYTSTSAGMPRSAFAVRATVTWNVSWHGGGRHGVFRGLHSTATLPVRVAEAEAVLRTPPT